jgi:hypothetical protein
MKNSSFTGSHPEFIPHQSFTEIESSNMGLLTKNKSPQVFYDNVQKIKEQQKIKKQIQKTALNPGSWTCNLHN